MRWAERPSSSLARMTARQGSASLGRRLSAPVVGGLGSGAPAAAGPEPRGALAGFDSTGVVPEPRGALAGFGSAGGAPEPRGALAGFGSAGGAPEPRGALAGFG